MTRRPGSGKRTTEALLLRRVAIGEADLIVELWTEQDGKVSALAKGARRSSKRFPALEPFHGLTVVVEPRSEALWTLAEATLLRPRIALTLDLDRIEAAGMALRWSRRALPVQTADPALWSEVQGLLDALNAPSLPLATRALLAGYGLRLLAVAGWGLELRACVRCLKSCDEAAAAYVNAAVGGLVCRACGGARRVLKAQDRRNLLAAIDGDDSALDISALRHAETLVEEALAAHLGFEA